jgi:hypothetical protein
MDKAPAYGAGDSGFESQYGLFFGLFCFCFFCCLVTFSFYSIDLLHYIHVFFKFLKIALNVYDLQLIIIIYLDLMFLVQQQKQHEIKTPYACIISTNPCSSKKVG